MAAKSMQHLVLDCQLRIRYNGKLKDFIDITPKYMV